MDFKDLQTKGEAELKELLAAEQVELQRERAKAHAKQLKQVHKLAIIRKTIARITMLLAKSANGAAKQS